MRGEKYLNKTKQYLLVYDKGSSWVSSLLVMKSLPNGLNLSRYGFSVSQRVGKAVVRNRIKRLLREILRQISLLPGWDIVFIARPRVAHTDYSELKNAVEKLLRRAGILIGDDERVSLKAN